jgi:hypothetical protein
MFDVRYGNTCLPEKSGEMDLETLSQDFTVDSVRSKPTF